MITREAVRRYVRFHLRRKTNSEITHRVKDWAKLAPEGVDPIEFVTDHICKHFLSPHQDTIHFGETQIGE